MKFVDCAPSTSPSLEQQRDALRKGLGRAMQWASAGCLADGPLLDACLKGQRHDMQIESCRAEWLWRIIEAVNAKGRFRVPILQALHEMADERDACQLCELGCLYAETGDKAFHARLFEIVEDKPFTDSLTLGEPELLRLDGRKALIFVAQRRGQELLAREWDWHDIIFAEEAVKLLGESQVRDCLRNSGDAALRRFLDRWDLDRQYREQLERPSLKERMQTVSTDDILSEARNEKPSVSNFRGWGMCAADSDLETVLEQLWASAEPIEIACLLRVFSNRALPSFDARLIKLCEHADDKVRRWAFNALENNSAPAIRQFALRKLNDGDSRAVALFINNYQQGDAQTILDGLELPGDQDELHWILLDVIKVLENNPTADEPQLAVVAYTLTPCETCRMYAARWLHQQEVAPRWLTEECQHDSIDDTRKLARQMKL